MSGIVIVGAGQAGASLAAKLRGLGHAGAITIIGEETAPPYQRPPLSKGYLLGEMELGRLYLRAPSFWQEQDITLKLGAPVTAIDQFALTTGSSPRRLLAAAAISGWKRRAGPADRRGPRVGRGPVGRKPIETDFVIVGVGITPATRLAEEAGLEIENGICTDEFGRTSDPAIWAAGDCASFPHRGAHPAGKRRPRDQSGRGGGREHAGRGQGP